jgi:hypothetical protein
MGTSMASEKIVIWPNSRRRRPGWPKRIFGAGGQRIKGLQTLMIEAYVSGE